MNGGTHEQMLMFSCLKIAASCLVGSTAQPSRQPVMAKPFEWPLTSTVFSCMPGSAQIELWLSPSNRMCS